ncbi:MAG: YggU family protein [SAR324 cluster bacterium]|nr:YggU family protein [SAR324 cluster bacterium]
MSSENGFDLKNDQLTLYLHIQPRASKSRWGNIHNNQIKLYITAPPVDDKANKQCISFLSKTLKVTKSNIFILHGGKKRNKVIRIKDIKPAHWQTVWQQIQATTPM